MSYIDEWKTIMRQLHHADSKHAESVVVRETFGSETVWEGIVEVFELIGHPTAHRVYAWINEPRLPNQTKQHVTVLHPHPVKSAQDAVRAALVQEFRSLESTE